MHEGKIYAMGGYNGRIRMNSVERYDPDANQWELISPMLRQRSDASAAALQDKVPKDDNNSKRNFKSCKMFHARFTSKLKEKCSLSCQTLLKPEIRGIYRSIMHLYCHSEGFMVRQGKGHN